MNCPEPAPRYLDYLSSPIGEPQAFDATEFTRIICDQERVPAGRCSRKQKIDRADRLAAGFKIDARNRGADHQA
jgi:hypothetical protein